MAAYGDVIFRRNNNMATSGSEDSSEDIWDDKILIDVYDKAINVVHEEVAKRLAMSTNSAKGDGKEGKKGLAREHKKQSNQNKVKHNKWKVGSECRAIYSGDGLEYEANITYIDGDNCVVTFIGYENEEETSLNSLKPSLGKEFRRLQISEAKCEEVDDKYSECDQSDSVTSNYGYNNVTKGKSKKSNKSSHRNSGMSLPPLSSFPFPSISANMMNLDNDMPLPPPPFMPPLNGNTSEDQALSTMLISWYMSGYYTGLYQGQKMAKRNSQRK